MKNHTATNPGQYRPILIKKSVSPQKENTLSLVYCPAQRLRTKEFWTLDTPVTQEIYESVMGSNPSCFRGKLRPVECVSWDDCQTFLGKLNTTGEVPKGMRFALPTEQQWKFACSASETNKIPVLLKNYAWYNQNSGDETQDVKKKYHNTWNIYDMLGNVWEWCRDVEITTSQCVVRGGAWNSTSKQCMASARKTFASNTKLNDIGFRIVLEEK